MKQKEAEALIIGCNVEHDELGLCKVHDILIDMGIVIEPLTEPGLKLLHHWTDTHITNYIECWYEKLIVIEDQEQPLCISVDDYLNQQAKCPSCQCNNLEAYTDEKRLLTVKLVCTGCNRVFKRNVNQIHTYFYEYAEKLNNENSTK